VFFPSLRYIRYFLFSSVFLAMDWVVQRHVQLRPDSLDRRKYSLSFSSGPVSLVIRASTHVRDGFRAFQGANLLFISHTAFLSWVVGRRRSFWLSPCCVSRTKVRQLRNLIKIDPEKVAARLLGIGKEWRKTTKKASRREDI
jgi:hypothetical protein